MIADNTPQGGHVRRILFIRSYSGRTWHSAPCTAVYTMLLLRRSFCWHSAVQSGALRFALIAFQLFTLPELFTLNALLPLPRFAERNRTLRPNSLQPFKYVKVPCSALHRFRASLCTAAGYLAHCFPRKHIAYRTDEN